MFLWLPPTKSISLMFDINDGGSDPNFDIGMRDPRE